MAEKTDILRAMDRIYHQTTNPAAQAARERRSEIVAASVDDATVLNLTRDLASSRDQIDRSAKRLREKFHLEDAGFEFQVDEKRRVTGVILTGLGDQEGTKIVVGVNNADARQAVEARNRERTLSQQLVGAIVEQNPKREIKRADLVDVVDDLVNLENKGELKPYHERANVRQPEAPLPGANKPPMTNQEKFEAVAKRLSEVFGVDVAVSQSRDFNGVPTFTIKAGENAAQAEAMADRLAKALNEAGIEKKDMPFEFTKNGLVKVYGGRVLNFGSDPSDVNDELFRKLEDPANMKRFRAAVKGENGMSSMLDSGRLATGVALAEAKYGPPTGGGKIDDPTNLTPSPARGAGLSQKGIRTV